MDRKEFLEKCDLQIVNYYVSGIAPEIDSDLELGLVFNLSNDNKLLLTETELTFLLKEIQKEREDILKNGAPSYITED